MVRNLDFHVYVICMTYHLASFRSLIMLLRLRNYLVSEAFDTDNVHACAYNGKLGTLKLVYYLEHWIESN